MPFSKIPNTSPAYQEPASHEAGFLLSVVLILDHRLNVEDVYFSNCFFAYA